MRAPGLALSLVVASLTLAACSSGGGGGGSSHPVGAESFVSAAPGGGSNGTAGGGPVAAASPPEATGGAAAGAVQPTRTVEEADLYALDGNLLLIQNAYRGLQVVDVSDLAHPRLAGKVALDGWPVGLYLRGTTALVISRDHLAWVLDPGTGKPALSQGSRLWAIDVSHPDAPAVTAELSIDGSVDDTRLVGDVLYFVSTPLPDWGVPMPLLAGADVMPLTPGDLLVASVDVSVPTAPAPVAQLDLPAAGWSVHVNIPTDPAPDRITVARSAWDPSLGNLTRLTAVDISDPRGALAPGAEVQVAGTVQDRWGLDYDSGTQTFRVLAQEGWTAGARLHVLSWATPVAATPLSELLVDVPEVLTAARFDGARAYAVTALRIDPLWVIDLTDPAHPALGGNLSMPGQLDYIEPHGDRLLALGHTNEAGSPFQLQVSLLDVTSPAAPKLLARVPFGPDWGFVPASADDLRKAFQVLDARGLVLVPFQGFDRTTWQWEGGTQLLAFGPDTLTLQGFVKSGGDVKRAFALGAQGALATFSDAWLQIVDATNPAAPVVEGSLELARPVADIAVAGENAAEVSGDWWSGSAELVVVPAADPDGAALARFAIAGAWARLYRTGAVVWTLSQDPFTGAASVEAFDLGAGPVAPRRRGRLDLPGGSGGAFWWWSAGAALAGDALAVERVGWSCAPSACQSQASLQVVDLRDPDAPVLAATVDLPGGAWTGGIAAIGTSVWYTQYEWVKLGSTVRYWVGRVDVADPAAPVLAARVNVPGVFFSASDDGATLYTEESVFPPGEPAVTWVHALALTDHDTARLLGSVKLAGLSSGAVREGAYAYAVVGQWQMGGVAVMTPGGAASPGVPAPATGAGGTAGSGAATGSGGATGVSGVGAIWYAPNARLEAVSLGALQLTSDQPLPAWGSLLAAAGGKLFLSQPWPSTSISVYGLADPGTPAFEQSVRTSGWVYDVVVANGFAYLPSGWYGVPRIALGP